MNCGGGQGGTRYAGKERNQTKLRTRFGRNIKMPEWMDRMMSSFRTIGLRNVVMWTLDPSSKEQRMSRDPLRPHELICGNIFRLGGFHMYVIHTQSTHEKADELRDVA